MHEMFHGLGYGHAMNAPARTKYVNIMWENIQRNRVKDVSSIYPDISSHVQTGLMWIV